MRFPKREAKDGGGHGADKFLKLKDGESVQGVFRGELYDMGRCSWSGQGYHPDPNGYSRYRLNFVIWDKEQKKFIAKIWEFGFTLCETLEEFNTAAPLEKTKVQITRKGTGKENTSYIVFPIGPVAAGGMPLIEAVELNILDTAPKKQEVASNGWDSGPADFGPEPEDSDEIPLPF